MDPEYLAKPHGWNAKSIAYFMIFLGSAAYSCTSMLIRVSGRADILHLRLQHVLPDVVLLRLSLQGRRR